MSEGNSPGAGAIAVLAGGAVTLIGSFFSFTGDTSAWGKGTFPIVTLIPIYATTVAAHVAIEHWGNVELPDDVAVGLTWRHLHLALSAFAFVMALFWWIADLSPGTGLYIMLVGTAACAVGSFMRMREVPAPVTGPVAVADGSPSPAAITLLAGAAVVLVGSFLDFEKVSFSISGVATVSQGYSAWSSDLYFPVTVLPVLCGLVIGIHLALVTFAKVVLPAAVVGFTWDQLYVVLGFQAVAMMIAFLIQDKQALDIAIGFWLMLLGSIALAVGAVLHHREVAAPAA